MALHSWRCILFARVAKRVFNLCFPSFYSNPSGTRYKPSSCSGRFFTCSGPLASFFTRVVSRRLSSAVPELVLGGHPPPTVSPRWSLVGRYQSRTPYISYHIRPLPLFARPPFTTPSQYQRQAPPQYPPHAQYQLATHPPGTVDSTYQKLSCRADLCGSCMQRMR